MEGGFFTLVSTFFKLFFIHVLWIRNFVVCLHHRNDAVPNKHHKIMKTIFTYKSSKGLNVETFEGCDITLERDDVFVYQHWVSSLMMNFYIHQLENELLKRGIEFTKEEIKH